MEKSKLFQIYKTESEKNEIILDNTLIMLSNRIFIKDGEKKPLIEIAAIKTSIIDKGDNTFTFTAANGDKFVLKIVYQKITATGKQSIVSEFIKEYAQYKKILVATDFNNKIYDFVTRQGIQIFRESALLQNIIDNRDQPKFELLSPAEMKKFKSEYNVTNYTVEKVSKNDAVVKYFGLKKGDIYRIIRPSMTSGQGIAYRIVH